MRHITAILGALCVLALASGPAGATATPIINTQPGQLSTPFDISYSLPGTCGSLTLEVDGFSNTFALVQSTATLSGAAAAAGDHTYGPLPGPPEVDGSSAGVDWNNVTIPDGSLYTVKLTCDGQQAILNGLSLRTSVPSPAILAPTSFSTINSTFTFEWLQQAAGDGTYTVSFSGPKDFTLSYKASPGSYPATITKSINLRLVHPPFGSYTVEVQYFDPLVGLSGSASVSGVVLAPTPAGGSSGEPSPKWCPPGRRC